MLYMSAGALHTAVVQDLARRLNVSCPAEPDRIADRRGPASSNVQQNLASVTAQSRQTAKLETTFVSSAPQSANSVDAWSEHDDLSTDGSSTALRALAHSAGSWASFCVQHDLVCSAPSSRSGQITAKVAKAKLQGRLARLQAIFADSNVSKAVAADPLLLSYRSETLASHMRHLQDLLGKAEASQIIAKFPELLHYKPSTLSDKLDMLYDMLPDADVGKVCDALISAIVACSPSVRLACFVYALNADLLLLCPDHVYKFFITVAGAAHVLLYGFNDDRPACMEIHSRFWQCR